MQFERQKLVDAIYISISDTIEILGRMLQRWYETFLLDLLHERLGLLQTPSADVVLVINAQTVTDYSPYIDVVIKLVLGAVDAESLRVNQHSAEEATLD